MSNLRYKAALVAVTLFSLSAWHSMSYAQSSSSTTTTSPAIEQIKAFVEKITNYLLPAPNNAPPQTPNVTATKQANVTSRQNYGNQTILTVPNSFDLRFDQPSPTDEVKKLGVLLHPNYTWPQNHPTVTEQAIYNLLTNSNTQLTENHMANLNIYPYPYIGPPLSPTTLFSGRAMSYLVYNALNLNSLLAPESYTTNNDVNELELALNFVRFVSNQASPENVPSFKTLQSAKTPDRNAYLVGLRSYVAAQSVGISNLNQMLAKRIVVPNLGTQAGLTTPPRQPVPNGPVLPGIPIADASQLQVDNFVANRRVQDPNWYATMEEAPPLTVGRETLYVLAEIEKSLNEMRKVDERILATLSAIELTVANNKRLELLILKNKLNPKQQTVPTT